MRFDRRRLRRLGRDPRTRFSTLWLLAILVGCFLLPGLLALDPTTTQLAEKLSLTNLMLLKKRSAILQI